MGGAAGIALPASEPTVRVGLQVDAASIHLGAGGRIELVDDEGRVRARGRGPWVVTPTPRGLRTRDDRGEMRVRGGLTVRPVSGNITVDGTRYRGSMLLRPTTGGITVVNVVDLEAYLRAVVPLEIGGGRGPDETEAVKAQAIAARTYAVRQLGRREDLGFDYHGSVLDQAYGGLDVEDATAARAVEATRGLVLVYDGQPIEAYYHATCGGRTAAVEEVWAAEPRPYLRSVSDARPDGGWYCEGSDRFRWTDEWDEEALLTTLSRAFRRRGRSGAVTRVESIEITRRTHSGRAGELVIRTNLGEERVRGDSIRWVLRPGPDRILNSTAIELQVRGGSRVTGLTVTGTGWGHGVGMCQVGALGRARAGQSYWDILAAYYPGTRIVRLYP